MPEQIDTLRGRLGSRTFDLLFVNAGVTNGPEETVADVTNDEFIRLMVTNALSPMRVIETLGEIVKPNGTIAIMSSGQGSIANNVRGGFEIHRASKSALNQLMRSYAARRRDDSRTLLLLAPGWVRTELGGPDARLTVEESTPRLVATVDAQRGRAGLQFSMTSARPSPGEPAAEVRVPGSTDLTEPGGITDGGVTKLPG